MSPCNDSVARHECEESRPWTNILQCAGGLSDASGRPRVLYAAGPTPAGFIAIVASDTIVSCHCLACLPVHLTLQFHKTEATVVSLIE